MLQDFVGDASNNQISARENDKVYLLNAEPTEAGWIPVKNMLGQKGWFPITYLSGPLKEHVNISSSIETSSSNISSQSSSSSLPVSSSSSSSLSMKTDTTHELWVKLCGEGNSSARAPVSILVILDHSGSMGSDNKLGQCKTTLQQLLYSLQPQDEFCLVIFDSTASIEVNFVSMEKADRNSISDIINKIQAN